MDGSNTTPSPQLVEANRRLYELRTQAQARRQATGLPADQARQVESDLPWNVAVPETTKPAITAEKIAALPAHLGWGSEALTAVLRRRQQEFECGDDDEDLSRAEPRETLKLRSLTISNLRAAVCKRISG